MHHSFVEALLRYLINENNLSKNPNWRRSALLLTTVAREYVVDRIKFEIFLILMRK
jgi:hypothetical protein